MQDCHQDEIKACFFSPDSMTISVEFLQASKGSHRKPANFHLRIK